MYNASYVTITHNYDNTDLTTLTVIVLSQQQGVSHRIYCTVMTSSLRTIRPKVVVLSQ